MPMSEMEYFRMEKNAAIGQVIGACAKAIFEAHDCSTMAELQRNMYKYTDAGIAISFELHDGTFVYSGDERARDIKDPWNWIRQIGVSSIVEGSDAEVPLTWIDLLRYADEDNEKYEGDLADVAKIAVKEFNELCDNVDEFTRDTATIALAQELNTR